MMEELIKLRNQLLVELCTCHTEPLSMPFEEHQSVCPGVRAWNVLCTVMPQPEPTEQFPDGKLNENDEGQIKMLISSDADIVRLDFGKPIAWFAMPKSQALTFAFTVLERCGVQIQHQIQQNPASGEPS